jgi:hypothetical protein
MREAMRRLMPFVAPGLNIVATLKDAKGINASAVDVYLDSAKALAKRGLLAKDWENQIW